MKKWSNRYIDTNARQYESNRVASIRDNVEYSNNVDEHGGKQKQMRRSQRNRLNTV
jgi:hypothetical protein